MKPLIDQIVSKSVRRIALPLLAVAVAAFSAAACACAGIEHVSD